MNQVNLRRDMVRTRRRIESDTFPWSIRPIFFLKQILILIASLFLPVLTRKHAYLDWC